MRHIVAQLPALSPGQLESWILGAAACGVLLLLFRNVMARPRGLEAEFVTREEFRLYRGNVERELAGLRDRIDSRHLATVEALEKVRMDLLSAGEAREARLQGRLGALESAVARLDERTKE